MPKITIEVDAGLNKQIERIVRDGWFADPSAVVLEALRQMVEAKTFLGDSPPILHRFAADALNASKPETALKFVSRGIALLSSQDLADLSLYQKLVELRVQILLVLDRKEDAITMLNEAKEKLPNNPFIDNWLKKLKKK
jgi:Arc/MetJ-type ribon-helix-helix transcriptional regulator